MNKQTLQLILCIILTLLSLACARQKTIEVAPNESAADESAVMESNTLVAAASARLLDFTKADYDAALATDKLIVLYFYADWCPICKEEFPKMQGVFQELKTDKIIGFRVNYNDDFTDDDERALARKFGVAYQHTKVFVKNGKRILKAPDSWKKDRYLKEINKFLEQAEPQRG